MLCFLQRLIITSIDLEKNDSLAKLVFLSTLAGMEVGSITLLQVIRCLSLKELACKKEHFTYFPIKDVL